MTQIKKTVKVYKQRALVMTIPVVFLKALGIELGTKLNLVLNEKNQSFTVTKAKEK